jgi:hypothetical protein
VAARNIELVREAIDAMNRGDLEWLVEHAAPDIAGNARSLALVSGWQVLRQRGSHEVWGKPGEPRR